MTGRLAGIGMAIAALGAATPGWTETGCATVPHMDHPHARISNGKVSALVFLPDAKTGYYRSSRFDWSGIVGCAAYAGHTYWGEWFSHYDPMVNDAITGPVEEFRTTEGALGYDAAGVGGLFVKIGVGVLRRDTAGAYAFGHVYPIVDTGRWTVKTRSRSVTFRQRLRSPTGVVYEYTKVLSLDADGTTLTLEHSLKNLGVRPIVTQVYDHDFFVLGGQPTGPGVEFQLPFTPVSQDPLLPGAEVVGRSIVYRQTIPDGGTVASYLTGYGPTPDDYDFELKDTSHGFGVRQQGDHAIAKFYLWSIRRTISPEVYISLQVAPGKTEHWKIQYTLEASASR